MQSTQRHKGRCGWILIKIMNSGSGEGSRVDPPFIAQGGGGSGFQAAASGSACLPSISVRSLDRAL